MLWDFGQKKALHFGYCKLLWNAFILKIKELV